MPRLRPVTQTPRVPGVLAAVLLLASAACAAEALRREPPGAAPARQARRLPAQPARKSTRPERVDPRAGGFEIVLGEWAITPEAKAIRPGTVTFVIRNRGTMGHGYEMELEGDSSGHGSGDLFKAESELQTLQKILQNPIPKPSSRGRIGTGCDG